MMKELSVPGQRKTALTSGQRWTIYQRLPNEKQNVLHCDTSTAACIKSFQEFSRVFKFSVFETTGHNSNVSVRFWPSCVEGMQMLRALRFCRRFNLVGENVICVRPGDVKIHAGQQLCQRFSCVAFQQTAVNRRLHSNRAASVHSGRSSKI